MITVTANDGNPVQVVFLIPGLTVPFRFFGANCIKGKFIQSGSGDSKTFVVTRCLPNADLVIRLSDWSLDFECKMANSSEELTYTCRQFPGQIVPQDAKYEILKSKVILKLPKADPSQSWAGELTATGLDQAPS